MAPHYLHNVLLFDPQSCHRVNAHAPIAGITSVQQSMNLVCTVPLLLLPLDALPSIALSHRLIAPEASQHITFHLPLHKLFSPHFLLMSDPPSNLNATVSLWLVHALVPHTCQKNPVGSTHLTQPILTTLCNHTPPSCSMPHAHPTHIFYRPSAAHKDRCSPQLGD
jgi:hypothetical protein